MNRLSVSTVVTSTRPNAAPTTVALTAGADRGDFGMRGRHGHPGPKSGQHPRPARAPALEQPRHVLLDGESELGDVGVDGAGEARRQLPVSCELIVIVASYERSTLTRGDARLMTISQPEH